MLELHAERRSSISRCSSCCRSCAPPATCWRSPTSTTRSRISRCSRWSTSSSSTCCSSAPRELARHAFKLSPYGLTLVAEKIESYEDFRLAKAAGADLFQGYLLLPPAPDRHPRDPPEPTRADAARERALQDPEIQLADLERLITGDVGLSYRLLKYINSAYFGLRGRISSIKQAVALLGIEQLRRWATLSIFADLSDKPRELFVTALIRAHFCQHAGEPRGRAAGRAVHARPVLRARRAERHLDVHGAAEPAADPVDARCADRPRRRREAARVRDGDRAAATSSEPTSCSETRVATTSSRSPGATTLSGS